VHHRVKNNLAAIASLFYLQAQTTEDPATLALLEECRNRVYSMSLVHELLYRSANLAVVDLADYTRSLARHLLSGQANAPSIRLVTELVSVRLEVDRAIPCGLVLNEMLTNAFKHAFRGRDAGAVTVRVELEEGRCRLSVADDGIGVRAVDGAATRSIGLRLMRALAGQLEGSFELANRADGPGACAVLEFVAQPADEAA
jgi:two-component sensor histidine kinase